MNIIDSKAINALRLPLAIMVVAIHSYIAIEGWQYDSVASQGMGSNMAQFFMISIGHVLTHVAVPSFFLISGYLFFNNFGEGNKIVWRGKFTTRINTLIIPFILWILLYIVFSLILGYKTILSGGLIEWWESHGGLRMFWCSETWNLERVDVWGHPYIASSPILVPFWYMRDLIVCIAATPILDLLFNKKGVKVVKVVGVGVISFLYFTQTSLYMGSILSLWNKSLTAVFSHGKYLRWTCWVLLFVLQVFFNGHNTIIGNVTYPLYVFVGVWSLFAIAPRIAGWGGQNFSFFIFAFHIFVLPFVRSGVSMVITLITGETITNTIVFADKYPFLVMLEYCLIIAITVTICMGVYLIVRRFFPRFCKLLCGR